MRVLVTGAAGFLGARTVEALVRRGHEVHALVRPSSPVPDWPTGVHVWHGDLRVRGAAAEALEGVEAVVHLAAQMTGTDEAQYHLSGGGVNVDLVAGTGAGGDASGDALGSIENLPQASTQSCRY